MVVKETTKISFVNKNGCKVDVNIRDSRFLSKTVSWACDRFDAITQDNFTVPVSL